MRVAEHETGRVAGRRGSGNPSPIRGCGGRSPLLTRSEYSARAMPAAAQAGATHDPGAIKDSTAAPVRAGASSRHRVIFDPNPRGHPHDRPGASRKAAGAEMDTGGTPHFPQSHIDVLACSICNGAA